MLRFRPQNELLGPTTDLLAVGQVIDNAMRPGHFFGAAALSLTWVAAKSETIRWEIFRGRLIDAAHTRQERTFLSWHLAEANAAEPTISVKLDVHQRRIHVTRGLLTYAHEGYDAGGGVIESREVVKWTRELVGTIALAEFADCEPLRDELICLIWQAVVGTSRLPLTSVEAPLPAFVLGQLAYRYAAGAAEQPIESWEELLSLAFGPDVAWGEPPKIIEAILRAISLEEVPRFTEVLLRSKPHGWAIGELRMYWQRMFNEVSLSPYTRFVENALLAMDLFVERKAISPNQRINFLGHMLRLLGRHLTAYDLVTFHHRGANYPDALVLDAVLKRFLGGLERFPDLFRGADPTAKIRRRALRQGCLMRRHYEGHLVPDAPTSPGENARVMPARHPRVPEEQLLQTLRRRRQLFANDPLTGLLTKRGQEVLAESIADLEQLDERAELGLGVFIDRPLGYAKDALELDQTPLLAHEAFSPSIARRRWRELKKLCAELALPCDAAKLDPLFETGSWPAGLPHTELAECRRPTAALCDVRKVADDFVIVRTKPIGMTQVLWRNDFIQHLRDRFRLAFLAQAPRLCVQALDEAKQPTLALFDDQFRRRVEIEVDVSQGLLSRAGVEFPRAGLRVGKVWEDTDDPAVLNGKVEH